MSRRGETPTPTPPTIEIFADAACTTKPSGSYSQDGKVYVRVNEDVGDTWWRVDSDGTTFLIGSEIQGDPYTVSWFNTEQSGLGFTTDLEGKPSVGDVFELEVLTPGTFSVDGWTTEFTKP